MLTEYKRRVLFNRINPSCTRVLIFILVVTLFFLFKITTANYISLFFLTSNFSQDTSSDTSVINVIQTGYENLIYFHETSGKGLLNSRQACAVESAARTHPQWKINVLFLERFLINKIDTKCINALKIYSDIYFNSFELLKYSEGSPIEGMIRDGVLNKSLWQVSHTSDALRYLSLYKTGGVYLDLDVIVVKSFENLTSNWGARESNTSVAAGAMSFSGDKLGREIAESAIKDFSDNFNGQIWGHNGPGVITRILKKMCKTNDVTEMHASRCKGFEVYGPELFYPVRWQDAKDYFSTKKLEVGEPYMFHTWNARSSSYKVTRDSVYAELAKKYCPEIYKAYGKHFGT